MDQKNEYAIRVKNLYKDFKWNSDKPGTLKEKLLFSKRNKVVKVHILKDIDLDIKKGETVALIGTNGSGKSTLLKLMVN